MKKILPLLLSSFLAVKCGDVVDAEPIDDYRDTFKEDEDEEINIGDLIGAKKLAVVGLNLSKSLEGKEVNSAILDWSYNLDTSKIGAKYKYLPGKLQIYSSSVYNLDKYSAIKSLTPYKASVKALKSYLVQITSSGTTDLNNKLIILPTGSNPDVVFSDSFVDDLYRLLGTDQPTLARLYTKISQLQRFLGRGVGSVGKVSANSGSKATDETSLLFDANALHSTATIDLSAYGYVPYLTLVSSSKIEPILRDKFLEMYDKNYDAIFIQNKDTLFNSEDVYKAFVNKEKDWDGVHIILIGDKAKSQSGTSSKTFAKKEITTGSYDKFASAYIAGFQSAVAQLKWSKDDLKYEPTEVTYLIGSISESEAKKKAFAFRRGVEAAKNHKDYSKYLKVKFVSKTEDSSKQSKKLYREVSGWKEISDGRTKLNKFANSDVFVDADKRVVYIAGTSAKDWRGKTLDVEDNQWDKNDDTGLIGALYNYKKVESDNTQDSDLSSKKFSRGIQLILDNYATNNNDKNDLDADNTKVERRDVKVLGYLGNEASGTKEFSSNILQALFLKDKEDRRLEKHSIFGGVFIRKIRLNWTDTKYNKYNEKYILSIENAFNTMPLTKEEIVKESAWLK